MRKGDRDSLQVAMLGAGVEQSAVSELLQAIDNDAAAGHEDEAGPKVSAWLTRFALKAGSAVGTGASVDIVVELLKKYFGV